MNMSTEKYPLLNRISSPADLKAMDAADMPALCAEIRAFLIEHVTETGGHLASNLGVVELTVALHRVFDTPHDHIIFDVGHQSYVHKLLTGRRECFSELRKPGGLSGFTRRDESEHDAFGAGHSSTALSAAIGFAQADRLDGSDAFSVAIVGDGAFTGGMVHEALNNCSSGLRLIVILNENEMSISRNIGAFARHIAKIRSSPNYLKTKRSTVNFISRIPLIGKPLYRVMRDTKKFFKNMLFSSNFFEEMGLYYLGPANGNDYPSVERLLRAAKAQNESVVLHLKTVKGKGYEPAEKNPAKYHGIPPAGTPAARNFSAEMGELLVSLARKDPRICAVTASMAESTGLLPFSQAFPDRFFDVGIAEAHAATFCAGLAAGGKKPFFAVYSSFLQRAYDNAVHDIALQGLPVVFCVDRAGLSGADGPTHHGIFDVSFLSELPNFELFAPLSFASLAAAMRTAACSANPCAVRYPNAGDMPELDRHFGTAAEPLMPRADFGNKTAPRAVIITYGRITAEALKAEAMLSAEGVPCGVILLERLSPYQTVAERVASLLPEGNCFLLFLEEGIRRGGASMLLLDELQRRHSEVLRGKKTRIRAIDDFALRGTLGKSILASAGLTADAIAGEIRENL